MMIVTPILKYNRFMSNNSGKVQGYIQLIFVIIFIVGSISLSKYLEFQKPKVQEAEGGERKLYVKAQKFVPQNYQVKFEATGNVSTRAEIDITPQVSGRVVMVNDSFFEGGDFKAGETLFKIEPLDFELNVKKLEAEIMKAKTAYNIEKAQSDAAWEEWQMLNKDKAIPELVARIPQLEEAKANLESAKAQLEEARLDLKRANFSLPFSGSILTGNLEIGDYVTAGQSYGTAFDKKNLEVNISIDNDKLNFLELQKETNKVKITLGDSNIKNVYDGYIKRIPSNIDPQTRFKNLIIGFKQSSDEISLGSFAKMKIFGKRFDNVFILPSTALQKEGIIWQLNEDNSIKKIEPEIIFEDSNNIVLKEIPQDAKIIITRLSGASDGMKVHLSDEEDFKEMEGSSEDK